MSNSRNIVVLQTLSLKILSDTLTKIRSHQEKLSSPNTECFLTADYLLQEAREYVNGAWEMLKSKKSNASIALSRWVLEASLNLLWIVAERGRIEERHKILIGEALRNDACLLESYSKIWPNKREQFEEKARKAREIRGRFGVEKPESLEKRLDEVKQVHIDIWPEMYPFYRICCAAAHPSLKVWERYNTENEPISYQMDIWKQLIACWMAAASTFHLVIYIYCLTELPGDLKQLKDLWEKEIRPLLNDD